MSTLEEEYNEREPKEAPNPYPDLPPLPLNLLNPRVIGRDTDCDDVLCVGLLNEFTVEECAEGEQKLVPHAYNGTPYLVKSTRGKGPWIMMRVAWRDEIERYNKLFLNEMNIEDYDHFPAYEDRLPPFPFWFEDAVVVKVDQTHDGTLQGYAVAKNKNDGEIWAIKTVGQRIWVSDHVATGLDLDMYDEALMKEMKIKL